MAYTKTTKHTSADGLALLTPQFIKVRAVDDFYEVGASKWKIRTDLEGLKDLYEKIGEVLEEEGEI